MKYLDKGLELWIKKTARNNLWKVGAWYDLDDLIQEGYVVYYKCLKGFRFDCWDENGVGGLHGRELTAEEHKSHKDRNWEKERQKTFVAYFKLAYANKLFDLAQEKTKTLDSSFSDLVVETETDYEKRVLEVPIPEEVSLHMALVQAPTEVLEMFQALIKDASQAGSYLRSRLRRKTTTTGSARLKRGRHNLRETTSQHYERVLGRPGGVDLLKEYLAKV